MYRKIQKKERKNVKGCKNPFQNHAILLIWFCFYDKIKQKNVKGCKNPF